MVVHDHPGLAVLHIREAVAGRQGLGFAVLYVGERVVAGIDGGVAVHADQLIPKRDLDLRQRAKGTNEIGADPFGTGTHGRRHVPHRTPSLAYSAVIVSGFCCARTSPHFAPAAATSSLGPAHALEIPSA